MFVFKDITIGKLLPKNWDFEMRAATGNEQKIPPKKC